MSVYELAILMSTERAAAGVLNSFVSAGWCCEAAPACIASAQKKLLVDCKRIGALCRLRTINERAPRGTAYPMGNLEKKNHLIESSASFLPYSHTAKHSPNINSIAHTRQELDAPCSTVASRKTLTTPCYCNTGPNAVGVTRRLSNSGKTLTGGGVSFRTNMKALSARSGWEDGSLIHKSTTWGHRKRKASSSSVRRDCCYFLSDALFQQAQFRRDGTSLMKAPCPLIGMTQPFSSSARTYKDTALARKRSST